MNLLLVPPGLKGVPCLSRAASSLFWPYRYQHKHSIAYGTVRMWDSTHESLSATAAAVIAGLLV